MTIVFSTHQPDHAAAVADDVALMFKGGSVTAGTVVDTMTAARLSDLFGVDVRRAIVDGGNGADAFVPVWDLNAGASLP